MADKSFHERLQAALEDLQLKSVEELLNVIERGGATAAHLKAADDICKRHGIQFDPTSLQEQVNHTLKSLPFAPPNPHDTSLEA